MRTLGSVELEKDLNAMLLGDIILNSTKNKTTSRSDLVSELALLNKKSQVMYMSKDS